MRSEDIRLLIVVENTDYRKTLADIFMPEMMPDRLVNRVSAADMHILTEAARWSTEVQEIAIFSCCSQAAYSEPSYLNIRLMGSGVGEETSDHERDRIRLVADFCPTHIVMCTPRYDILSWANRNHISTVVLLSEWQEPLGWRQQWQHSRLIRQLNQKSINWVGTHGVYACKILKASGVDPHKLIPWEWPQPELPSQYPPKQIRPERASIDLVYAGPIDSSAGISDLLLAISQLRSRGTIVRLQLIGEAPKRLAEPAALATDREPFNSFSNELELFQVQAQQLDIADAVSFLAAAAPEQIIELMRVADLVIIPHLPAAAPVSTVTTTSAEAPFTQAIADEVPLSVYLAMAARTPIVASDHPSFSDHLFHGVNAMIFPAGNAKSMAHRIERIMGQPQLYAQLSEAATITLKTLKIPAHWAELIERWIGSQTPAGADNLQWLCNCAFSSGRYQVLSASHGQIQSQQRSTRQRSARQRSTRQNSARQNLVEQPSDHPDQQRSA
jgi:glycosyltransferase involved in cell wall biosynthesis